MDNPGADQSRHAYELSTDIIRQALFLRFFDAEEAERFIHYRIGKYGMKIV